MTNLSTSRVLEDVATAAGQTLTRAPVGEINVARHMQQVGAVIGGEGNGGVILPDIHPQDAIAVAERIRAQIDGLQIYLEDMEPFSVQASLGVASNHVQFPSLSKLIDAADQALYLAKQEGRNRVCIYKHETD